jgi:hypothetical protein
MLIRFINEATILNNTSNTILNKSLWINGSRIQQSQEISDTRFSVSLLSYWVTYTRKRKMLTFVAKKCESAINKHQGPARYVNFQRENLEILFMALNGRAHSNITFQNSTPRSFNMAHLRYEYMRRINIIRKIMDIYFETDDIYIYT